MKGIHQTRQDEVREKAAVLRTRMAQDAFDAIVLTTAANIAWITAGARTFINIATDGAQGYVLVTPTQLIMVTDSIEAPRMKQEEQLEEVGFEFFIDPWHTRSNAANILLAGKKVASDSLDFGADYRTQMKQLRSVFTEGEMDKMRIIGSEAAEAISEVMYDIQPGMTEFEISGLLSEAAYARGGLATVNLVAADERIFTYRHPLPTTNEVDKYIMVVLCYRKFGLVASVTRLAHFGPIPDDILRRANAVGQADTNLILGTLPGKTMGDLFEIARNSYAQLGFSEAIEQHHQGGSAGYAPREFLALPGSDVPITANQAFAWNPSVSGCKSEDTVLLTRQGIEVVTEVSGWPAKEFTANGSALARPAILEII